MCSLYKPFKQNSDKAERNNKLTKVFRVKNLTKLKFEFEKLTFANLTLLFFEYPDFSLPFRISFSETNFFLNMYFYRKYNIE